MARRSEIQYALAQTRWLIMEGSRCENLETLFDDTAFVADKLGFIGLKIRMMDTERIWQKLEYNPNQCWFIQPHLPGQDCHIEFTAPIKTEKTEESLNMTPQLDERTFQILADLLTEGWIKSIAAWSCQSGQPLRFGITKN